MDNHAWKEDKPWREESQQRIEKYMGKKILSPH